MVDLVTQLLLNASQIILGLTGVEESEVVCILHLHPYQHRASKQAKKKNEIPMTMFRNKTEINLANSLVPLYTLK